jgi:3-phosphoshikimate 1-carboxyvinyltransferase
MTLITYNPVQINEEIEIKLPYSKSISNRALILCFLTDKNYKSIQISDADDSKLLVEKLNLIEKNIGSDTFVEININNAGTAMRFLTSLLSITPGKWILTGDERMQQRPIGELVDALISLGASIKYLKEEGFPPLKIEGRVLEGGEVDIVAFKSSQFITSLLLIAPFLKNGLKIKLVGNITSYPYILLTINLLRNIGVNVYIFENEITIYNNPLQPNKIKSEIDWSSAGYWYEIVAFSSNVSIKLIGLRKNDYQGDAILSKIFENFGVHTEFVADGIILRKIKEICKKFDFDFTNYPDIAQTIAVTCLGLGIKARLNGLASLKIKETDRFKALCNELIKINGSIKIEDESSFSILPSEIIIKDNIKTYNDHRMIMSFAPLAILTGKIGFDNIIHVSKSYPNFWLDIEKIGIQIED